jgi:choline-sulfatase
MPDRPNILFLMSDQHRADVSGFAGDSVVRTPVLDELAKTGVVFSNAYTPSPICVPGRQCMMSGKLPKTAGCEGWIDLPPSSMTFARRLSQYAYHTVVSGKLHHLGEDQMQGWTQRIAPDAVVADDQIEGAVAEEFARYEAESGTGKWSNQKEVEQATATHGAYQEFDARATSAAVRHLRRHFTDIHYDRPRNHRPLLFKLSLLQPHYPFFTTEDRLTYYMNRVEPWIEEPCDHPVLSLSQQNKPVHVSARDIRKATAAYYAMIETVDDYYGQVLHELERVGENLDEWIIIYTSDHGEMLGEHGIWEKTRFYEGSVRVPLIIRWPRRFQGGRTVTENVNLCDLFATICDLAGVPTPPDLDSRSLVPLLEGSTSDWMDETVSQFGRDHVMIKQGPLKYQWYGEDIREVLFDLKRDPREHKNVIDEFTYADAVKRFRARLATLGHGPGAAAQYVNAGY